MKIMNEFPEYTATVELGGLLYNEVYDLNSLNLNIGTIFSLNVFLNCSRKYSILIHLFTKFKSKQYMPCLLQKYI